MKFHGSVNKASVNVKAGVYGIPIKGDLKFNKVELFVKVSTFSVVKARAIATGKKVSMQSIRKVLVKKKINR